MHRWVCRSCWLILHYVYVWLIIWLWIVDWCCMLCLFSTELIVTCFLECWCWLALAIRLCTLHVGCTSGSPPFYWYNFICSTGPSDCCDLCVIRWDHQTTRLDVCSYGITKLMNVPAWSLDHVCSFWIKRLIRLRMPPNRKLTVHLARLVVAPLLGIFILFLCLIFVEKMKT